MTIGCNVRFQQQMVAVLRQAFVLHVWSYITACSSTPSIVGRTVTPWFELCCELILTVTH